MSLLETLTELVTAIPAELKEKRGVYSLEFVVAERKAFLSTKKLIYKASFRIVEDDKKLKFTEMLKESGMGLSSGGGDMEMSSGFGFKAGVYKSGSGGLQGTIEEQSKLFGKKYEYKFNFGELRQKFEAKAKEAGYQLAYQTTSIGL